MKKINIIIVSLIVAIVVLILGTTIYINASKLPTEPLDENGILELLNKGLKIKNVYIETVTETQGWTQTVIKYQKDGISKSITPNENNTIINWENMNTNECIEVQEGYKMWYKIPEDNGIENKYKFIRYEKYNNSKCVVVDVTIKEENITTFRAWIDLKLGVFLKTEYTNNFGEEYASYSTVKLNKVKDEDVQKPNLEGYTEYKYEE